MKEIIVAIDFSKCSLHALDYAIMIANQMHANIKMVWVDNQSSVDMVFTKEEQLGCWLRRSRKGDWTYRDE